MTKQQAQAILGNKATWEMKAIKKALNMLSLLNTPEENLRLQAVTILLSKKA